MTDDELSSVERKVAADPAFSAEEAAILREVISTYRGLRAFGRLARIVVVSLAALGAGVAAWDMLMERVKAWLAG